MYSGVVFDVFTHEGDNFEVFVFAVSRVFIRYNSILHVCMYTMSDSTTTICAMCCTKLSTLCTIILLNFLIS